MTKICTDIEQSKKLIELGIDVNTADMFWLTTDKSRLHILVEDLEKYSRWDCMPAWSLSALLNLLPIVNLIKLDNGTWTCISNGCRCDANDPINACTEMIQYLVTKKLI